MINILTVVNDRSYGIWGKNFMKALHYLNHPYSFFPLHGIELKPDEQDFVLPVKQGVISAETFTAKCPSLTIWHATDLIKQIGNKRVAWTLFELTRLTNQEKHQLGTQDLLIFPSNWHCQIAQKEGIKTDMKVCPLGVDVAKYFPIPAIKSPGKTIFLSVGKWEERKGHRMLPLWFSKAFTYKDPVELWVSHYNPFLTEEEYGKWKSYYINSVPGNQLRFIEEWLPENRLNELYNRADVGICLSRAEGFGLPNIEMLACGLPLIATNYAAHTEFLNQDNAHLVNINKLETAKDDKFFKSGFGEWAHLGPDQEEQTIAHMRKLHKEKQEKGELTNPAGIETAHNLTWLNIAQKIINQIGE